MSTSDHRFGFVVDDCLAGLRAGATVDDCLNAYPAHREVLEPLLRAAIRLDAAQAPAVGADTRTNSRRRLLAAVEREKAKAKPKSNWSWGRLFLVPALAAALVAALIIGLSTSQAPDEAEAATVITVLGGEVRILKGHERILARNGMRLGPGDRVETSPGARAVLTFFDGRTVTLDSETVVSIKSLGSENGSLHVALRQDAGQTWTHAPPGLAPSQIHIETPSNARVQGHDGAFSTRLDARGGLEVGAQGGPVEVTTGQQRSAVPGGFTASVDAGGVVGAPMAAAAPPKELVIRVAGTNNAYVTDPNGATVGSVGAGFPANQVTGATVSREPGAVVVRIPDPVEGSYSVGFTATNSGQVAVTAGLSAAAPATSASSDSANLQVASNASASVPVAVQGSRVDVAEQPTAATAAAPAGVSIPANVNDKIKAMATAAVSQPAAMPTDTPPPRPTQTPLPTFTPAPTLTPTPSPTPRPIATPNRSLNPTPRDNITAE